MGDRGHCARLAPQPVGVLGARAGERLERHAPAERQVRGAVDDPHPAFPDAALEAEFPEELLRQSRSAHRVAAFRTALRVGPGHTAACHALGRARFVGAHVARGPRAPEPAALEPDAGHAADRLEQEVILP